MQGLELRTKRRALRLSHLQPRSQTTSRPRCAPHRHAMQTGLPRVQHSHLHAWERRECRRGLARQIAVRATLWVHANPVAQDASVEAYRCCVLQAAAAAAPSAPVADAQPAKKSKYFPADAGEDVKPAKQTKSPAKSAAKCVAACTEMRVPERCGGVGRVWLCTKQQSCMQRSQRVHVRGHSGCMHASARVTRHHEA